MENWLNIYTFIAFGLGVLLSMTVKSFISSLTSKVKGASG